MNPLFHPTTANILEKLRHQLPQSLLLTGPKGIGLTTAAQWIANAPFVGSIAPRDTKGNETPEGTIGVETIRQLYEQTRSRSAKRQIILLHSAERMSPAASGAFLKLLEEPNQSTHFILVSHHPQQLLSTVRSRLQQATLQPLTKQQTDTLIDSLGINDTIKRRQLEFIAAGLPALLTRLVQDDDYFNEKAKIIGDARDFLKGSAYQKLLTIHSYKQDRGRTLQLCDAILALLQRSLTTQPQPSLIKQMEQLLEVRERIAANGNAALQLTQFVI